MSSTETKKQREGRRLINALRRGNKKALEKQRSKIQAKIAKRVLRDFKPE